MITKSPFYDRESSRKSSYITIEQIDRECPEIINKFADILFDKDYNEYAKEFARILLEFLSDWDYLTWKQFDSLLRISKNYFEYQRKMKEGMFYGNIGGKAFISRNGSCIITDKPFNISTDKKMDYWQEKIFGSRPVFPEELDGQTLAYARNGKRMFLLPEPDSDLSLF